MLVRSEIAGQKQILWIFGYKEGKNRLILSLGLGGIIQERGVGLKYPLLVGFSPAPLVAHCSLAPHSPPRQNPCLHFLLAALGLATIEWVWCSAGGGSRRPGGPLHTRAFLPGYRGFLRVWD